MQWEIQVQVTMVEEVGNDVGGLVGSVAGGVCVHRWYTRGRGGVGATNGARTTDGTSRGTSSTVEGKKGVVSKNVTSVTFLEAGVTQKNTF